MENDFAGPGDSRDPYDRSFTARYNGTCAECGEDIYEGDVIVGMEYGYVHLECCDE